MKYDYCVRSELYTEQYSACYASEKYNNKCTHGNILRGAKNEGKKKKKDVYALLLRVRRTMIIDDGGFFFLFIRTVRTKYYVETIEKV